jgi:DNA-binding transcriptional MerR regulator
MAGRLNRGAAFAARSERQKGTDRMTMHPAGAPASSNVVWIDDEAPQVPLQTAGGRPEQSEFTIGELAREFGVTLRALRFYENKGLIAPRRAGSARLYSQCDRARLAQILTGKRLGFTLTEIRKMISSDEARDAERLSLTKEKCLEQIHLLEKQQLEIKAALAELWRIHAGLSAEVIRLDWNEAAAEGSRPAGSGREASC